jgi:hypothetical protein
MYKTTAKMSQKSSNQRGSNNFQWYIFCHVCTYTVTVSFQCDSEKTDLKKKERFQGLKLYNINIPTCQMPVLNGTNRRLLKIRMDITNALWFSK